MAKPYSMDLRERVVAAVVAGGLSCHASAARFGVAPSSAIKWVRRVRETGSAAPGQMGGHKPNILSGPTRDWLLARAASDFTLRGLVAELAERGVKVDYVQVWRFVHAEGLSFKKRMARPVRKRFVEGGMMVCINVSGLKADALAKMDIRAVWSS